MKNKSLFSRLLENKKLLVIASLLLSLMFWIISSDNMAKTITDVPVECALPGNLDSQLKVFGLNPDTVSVEVKGKRVLVESLNPEDIDAYVDLSDVKGPITSSFPIVVKNNNTGYKIENIEPQNIRLAIDKEVSKSVKVISDFEYSPKEYYVEHNAPQTIEITGPEGVVESIRCAYISDKSVSSPNASSVTNSYNIKLYKTDNPAEATAADEVSTQYLTMSYESVDVTFRFLKLKENVPFKIEYSPSSIVLKSSYFDITPSTISIAGPELQITGTNAIRSLPIDIGLLSQYKNQIYNLTFDVNEILGNDFINKSEGVDTVKVQLDFSSLKSDIIEVPASKIKVKNLDEKYSYTPTGTYPITVIGTASALESLDVDDISIVYDFQNATLQEGNNYMDAKVNITLNRGDSLCWVYRSSDTATVIITNS